VFVDVFCYNMLIWDLSYVDNAIHATALIRQLLGQEGKADFVTKTSENIKKKLTQ